jgi:hypothetical protein
MPSVEFQERSGFFGRAFLSIGSNAVEAKHKKKGADDISTHEWTKHSSLLRKKRPELLITLNRLALNFKFLLVGVRLALKASDLTDVDLEV